METIENMCVPSFTSMCANLKFTHTVSAHSVDFLDLTIYKGPDFHQTHKLDLKTYQNPQNIYQYLEYTSNHPKDTHKAIIYGECIRYLRSNTRPETFAATIKKFEKRLLQIKYPKKLIGKVTARVKFSDRHSHLRKTTVNVRQVLPSLILKCLPPPRFDHLKKVILQEYPSIQQWVPKPRFVTLAHPTLRKILIRANTRPTTVQLFDILLQLENSPKNAGHKTAGVLPIIGSQTPRIRNPRCKTCTYLNCKPCFTSTVTRVRYPIRYSATCSTSNIVDHVHTMQKAICRNYHNHLEQG